MSKVVTVPLDNELEVLLNQMLQAKKTKNKCQVVREAIWEYSKKILSDNTTFEVLKDGNEYDGGAGESAVQRIMSN